MRFCFAVFIAIMFVGVITTSSCTKNYICHCVISYTNAPGLPDSTVKEYNITDTKGNAETTCRNQSGVFLNNNIYSIENCFLY